MSTSLRNWEIVLYALHLEGAASRRVHTEDVALRCFSVAPDAFSWLKHRKYPDKEVVRKDLIRLRMGEFGDLFVAGRAGKAKATSGAQTIDGWELTQAGAHWIVENESRIRNALGDRPIRRDRQEVLRAIERVRGSGLFERFLADGDAFSLQIGELAELLRCRVDAEETVWAKRFATLRNQAELAKETGLLEFANRCEQLLRRISQADVKS